MVLLPVGSRYETPEINGVSHFIEHLLFKGTKNRPTSLDISKELDSVGAEYNAFTAKDHTGYYVKITADKMELAFDVLADMIFNSLFDPKEIDKERGVIIEEINMYQDNPLIYLGAMFEQTIYGDKPLGRLISGPKKVIQKVSRGQILQYKEKFYQPANMVLVVAGGFNGPKARKLAQAYFGNRAEKKPRVNFAKLKISQTKPKVNLLFKDTQQVQIGLGFPAYSLTDERIYALYLLAVILGGNMSSRLFTVVREQHGLAYYIKTDVSAYQDTGSIVVQAGLDKQRLTQAIGLILAELNKVRAAGVSYKELKSAKEFLKGKLVLELEDSEEVADWYGKQLLLLDKIYTPQERLKKIFKVSQADIKKVAAEIFRQQRINFALIGPFKDKNKFREILHF